MNDPIRCLSLRKQIPLNSHLPTVRKLGKARATPVESRNTPASQPDEEPASRRILQKDVLPLLLSLTCVGLVTAVLLLLDQTVAFNLVPIAYLIPVIVAATRWGIWPATLASIASMAAADFFFFPPVFSFRVEDPQEAVDLMLFLVVALVSGNLASRLRLRNRNPAPARKGNSESLRILAAFGGLFHRFGPDRCHSDLPFPRTRTAGRFLRGQDGRPIRTAQIRIGARGGARERCFDAARPSGFRPTPSSTSRPRTPGC